MRKQLSHGTATAATNRQFSATIVREGFHPAGGLAPIEVFVRGLIAVLGEAQTHEEIRTFHALYEMTTAQIEPPSRMNAGSRPLFPSPR